ncbi:fatty acid desaturase family protein [Tundrisphaera sp. TA3]|uniref:fatty acid desaturase family protein n=1 Tax=Tundrisphaera sp. TA3 TaxID=3435775 RepID=UPI003EBB4FF1
MTHESPDLTAEAAHRAVVGLMRTDNRTNIGYIAREYLGLALVLAGCIWAYHAWSAGRVGTAGFVPMAAGVALVAVFQHRLSGLAHDASHGTLFRNRLANELASDLLLLFPLVAMTQKYRAAHLGHHRFVNDPERDPDLIRLNHPEPHHFPISKRDFWRRYVLRALWPPSILRYLIGRAKAANLDAGDAVKPTRQVYRMRVARSMRGAYFLSLLTVVHATGSWPIFWLFWVVPLLTVYPLLMQLREIAHHSNAPDDGDLTNSRVFRVHPLLNAAIFPYGQAFHLTHHLFAMVPHYRIAEAHEVLSRHRPYREQVVVCRGFFFRERGTPGPSLLELLATPPSRSIHRGPHARPSEVATPVD